jgi:enamine deaminase RidA (YjgF/YER057c/UK114 family)
MKKQSISSSDWDTPEAVIAGEFIFLSGTTSKHPDGYYLGAGDIEAQTHIVIDRIEASLQLAGSNIDNVVKVTVYLDDIQKWDLFNAAYLERFKTDRPARTTIQAGGFEEGACIELDVIAIRSDE